ncbi:MAG: glycosyl hydrolase [Sedimentisphaerales bacterium]
MAEQKQINLFTVCLLGSLISCAVAAKDKTDVGQGSYSTRMPEGVKLPPNVIYRTDNLSGPVPTTDWWSSLAWEQYSSNHFAHPLAMCASEEGLRISYPGSGIHATGNHIFASFQKELILGHSGVEQFPHARIDGSSDWFVDVLFAEGRHSMRLSYGHGCPFVFARYSDGGAKIRFESDVHVWFGDNNSPTLGVTVRGCHYGLFGPTASTWSGLGGRVFINHNRGKTHFTLAILPDKSRQTLELVERYAHTHIVGTEVKWRYVQSKGLVETDFTFETECLQGTQKDTLFALYPHQWQNTKVSLLAYSYNSIRGPMKLAAGNHFTTTMRFPGVLPSMPNKGKYDRNLLAKYIEEAAAARLRNPADTYWAGKELGRISNLIPIAQQLGDMTSAAHFANTLKSRLEQWFTASQDDQKKDRYFYYDPNWGTLIGIKPSYGSSDQLNDHHFHYGYFIRAAAEVARTDKNWAHENKWGAIVNLLIRDIANPDRNDKHFPFLRCFDPYAGHSWASGHAKFGDGNNQESSSEAMNAWTGIILWGQANENHVLRDLGIYLYTTEMNAINAYWFDVNADLFPDGYTQQSAALIWGGKTDFATWFSGKPEHIVGINLLPIQSGSLYLGLYPDYVRRNLKGLADLRGGYEWQDWREILWMYEALHDPDNAMKRFRAATELKDPCARAYAYHWISNLQAMGRVNRAITADCPTAVVFTQKEKNTYVAGNITAKPMNVHFSDGTQLTVQPGRFNTKP